MLEHWIITLPWFGLLGVFIVAIAALGKSADVLVEQAVTLSSKWGVPQIIIGATIVSLGTTFPEVVVSVMATLDGKPGIALGNAVGSIICDTGLIFGLAALIGKIPIDRSVADRQGWIQLAAGIALAVACLPFGPEIATVFQEGGRMPRAAGWFFVVCLIAYLVLNTYWARNVKPVAEPDRNDDVRIPLVLLKMLGMLALLGLSSEVLITTASEMASRLSIPDSVVAVTLVAFGTSLPELVTAISAVRKGHGEIALGNVIGADILNVFLVAGASAAFSPNGLMADATFYRHALPTMVAVLIILRLGLTFSGKTFQKGWAAALFGTYLALTLMNFAKVGG